MLELKNRELRVELLDPVANAARLGPRFCWGGYIWQIHDSAARPLLSGPEWPNPEPSAFNGQGLPESFRHRTLEGQPLTWRGEQGIAIGAGTLHCDAAGHVTLARPCRWDIVLRNDQLSFVTRDAAAGFSYELTRTIGLAECEVHSNTQLTNTSDTHLKLEWFAHPFFPLIDGMLRAHIPSGAVLSENPGFVLTGRTLTQKRRFLRQDDGHMDRSLRLPPEQSLVATLDHPKIACVTFETRFAPDACVIWSNDRTFSFEPYLTLDLAPSETRHWSLRYRFSK